ncbi:hypothetical protein [Mesorhizobium sp. CN2-181]|uniref:hypothetical protein n=1 Tax=Mesorhizobium yinganensis TaxID=3157707 RepID=UPI0032B6FD6C
MSGKSSSPPHGSVKFPIASISKQLAFIDRSFPSIGLTRGPGEHDAGTENPDPGATNPRAQAYRCSSTQLWPDQLSWK